MQDKWRNIQLVSGETGTRQRHKYSAENIQPNTDHVDILGNSSTSVDVEFKVRDKPLRRTKETLPTRAPTERMSRYYPHFYYLNKQLTSFEHFRFLYFGVYTSWSSYWF